MVFPALVNQAQMIGVTPLNIIAGFQATGIHPFNRDILSETDFAPADPTDCEQDAAAASSTEVNITPEDTRAPDATPAAASSSSVVQPQRQQAGDV